MQNTNFTLHCPLTQLTWFHNQVPAADTHSVYDLHAKCVSKQCSVKLVFHLVSDLLPADDPFMVETCRSSN